MRYLLYAISLFFLITSCQRGLTPITSGASTETQNLLNYLIWVWNANGLRDWKDDEAMAYELYYPGDEYVDVLAADIYKADYKQSHHDRLIELGAGKPIALGEIGKVPDPSVLTQQPKWTWFMTWARFPWTHNTKEEVKALYSDPKVLTLDELDN